MIDILRPPAFNKHIGLGIESLWELIGQNKTCHYSTTYLKLLVKGNSIALYKN